MGLKSFTAYLDAVSIPFLEDAVVDYATDRMGGQLTIKAPNAKVPMVNADSPINERINYYLQTEINPGLASHGGQVNLIEVVEDGIAGAAVRRWLPGLRPGRRYLARRHRAHLARTHSGAQGRA